MAKKMWTPVKGKKTCTVGPENISDAEKKSLVAAAKKARSRLVRRAARLENNWGEATDAERAFVLAVSSLPQDPGPSHPCRMLWARAIMMQASADMALQQYLTCFASWVLV